MKIENLTTKGSLSRWIKDSIQEGAYLFALDLETTDLGKGTKILSGAITGPNENWVGFISTDVLPELLDSPEGTEFIFHNAPFDLKHLAWNGVNLHERYRYHDTLISAHLLDENGEHGLGPLVLRYYNDNYKEEFWAKYKKAEDATEEDLAEYNAKDVHYAFRLYTELNYRLAEDGIPKALVEHVHKLQKSLLETEIAGIAVDIPYLMQRGVELKTRIESLLPEMRSLVSDEISIIESDAWVREIEKLKTPVARARVRRPEFSFDSSKQLIELLYTNLALPVQRNEKTKAVSADFESLEKIKHLHPVVSKLQDYREANKIYGTYIEGTLERMVEGRIYPSFNVTGTATGRISHSNPNMGNMPRDGGIRGIFVPEPGYVFISADFSQLEVCLSAHFTRDENFLRIVNEGASQHDITAVSLGIARGLAKTVNFGMQYGCSAYKVAKVLGVSQKEGELAYAKYWETYAGQKRVMDECSRKVDSGEPIRNPFGRRRRFEVRKRAAWDGAYRRAWNALVQGTGSDCTSRAFYITDAALRDRGIGRALFTVHDEIICQVKKENWEEAQSILVENMKKVGQEIELTVTLKAEASGPCDRWLD